jgi:hypothetical protein
VFFFFLLAMSFSHLMGAIDGVPEQRIGIYRLFSPTAYEEKEALIEFFNLTG